MAPELYFSVVPFFLGGLGAAQTAAYATQQLFSVHPAQATCLQPAAEANRSIDKGPQNAA